MLITRLKMWNRRRLEARKLQRDHVHHQPIDALVLTSLLGLNRPLPLAPRLAIDILNARVDASRFQQCLASLAVACERLGPGGAFSVRLPNSIPLPSPLSIDLQWTNPALPSAPVRQHEDSNFTHYLCLSPDCILEPDALVNMLRMSEACGNNAVIDALHFPQALSKPLDIQTLDTEWASTSCMLVPRAAYEAVTRQGETPLLAQAERALSESIKNCGIDVKTCLTALVCCDSGSSLRISEQSLNDSPTETLSILIRFHDASRLPELKRCLFSVINSTYPSIEAVVICQNIPPSGADAIRQYGQTLSHTRPFSLKVVQPELPRNVDCRSRLLNVGLVESSGRYVGFLDYDDCIYPDAYRRMIDTLHRTDSAISFGDIKIKHAFVHDAIVVVRRQSNGWGARSLADLLHDNCCPIHSYIFDRSRFDGPAPQFDESLSKYEDYDFLLQICAAHTSSFDGSDIVVGDYYIKEDGSNTVITTSSYTPEARNAWARSKSTVINRRDATQISEAVRARVNIELASLGMPALPSPCTIAHFNERAKALRKLKQK